MLLVRQLLELGAEEEAEEMFEQLLLNPQTRKEALKYCRKLGINENYAS